MREGDTYFVTGEKHLITFGTIADYLLLIARTEGTKGAEGTLALMVAPQGEGVQANGDGGITRVSAGPITPISCSTTRRFPSPTASGPRARGSRSRSAAFWRRAGSRWR